MIQNEQKDNTTKDIFYFVRSGDLEQLGVYLKGGGDTNAVSTAGKNFLSLYLEDRAVEEIDIKFLHFLLQHGTTQK